MEKVTNWFLGAVGFIVTTAQAIGEFIQSHWQFIIICLLLYNIAKSLEKILEVLRESERD